MSTTADENAGFLRRAFTARLVAARPESVLDVGAGGGAVLALLREARVPAVGCEDEEPRVAALRAAGFDAVRARAEELPFDDGAFDWVCMRHVPHHLADPPAGLREALRVARRGLLVAEPWYDVELPGQRAALAAERWLKARHRAAGMVHGENLSAAALVAAAGVPLERGAPDALEVELAQVLRLRARALEDLEAGAAPWLEGLAPDDAAREDWERVRARAARDGLSWNGSVLVALTRR